MKKTIVFSAIALVVGFAAGAFLFKGGGKSNGKSDSAESAKEEIWTCSMHPNVKAPRSGLCPICAMDLIPLSSMGPAGGARDYTMSEEAKIMAGITTVPVMRQLPEAEVRLFGKVVYNESRINSISARFDGRLDKLFVNFTGVRVKKGDHLALVYSPDLLTAQSELLTAKRFGNSTAIRLARDKLRLWGFSREQTRQIESTGKVLDQLTVAAPASGIVTHLNVKEGDYVKTGTRFFQIADLSEVWVLLQAYESDLPWLRYGQSVSFTVESFPGRSFEGIISFIPPDLDPKTRTISIRVNVPNPAERLKPGMFVRGSVKARVSDIGKVVDPSLSGKWISPMHPEVVKDGPGKCDVCGMDLVPAEQLGYSNLSAEEANPPLLVPSGAVLHTGKRSIVYVQVPDSEEPTFEGRDVLIGPRTGNYYIVEAGLKEGEQVVAEGGFVIDSALQIQAKDSMMLPGQKKPLYRRSSVPHTFLTGIDQILQIYFNIQSALAADSLPLAKSSAENGMEALPKIDLDKVSTDAGEIWARLDKKLAKSFASIRGANNIKIARTEFRTLTAITEEMVLRFGSGYLPVFEMHCPMAFNDTGASWFQPDKELLNPYFGAEMLRCGTTESTLSEGRAFPVPEPVNRQLETIIKSYFSIATGLAGDDNQAANQEARELGKRLIEFDAAALTNNLSLSSWKKLSENLTDQAGKMSDETSIASNRVHFEKLTKTIKRMVKQFGGSLSFPVNEMHCPMAFDNEGANWLAENKDINNPYFGAKMLKCGEITETVYTPAK